MKILYIGCVLFSKTMMEKLIEINAQLVGVISKENSDFNADFYDIVPIAKKYNIPSLYVEDINDKKNILWIKKMKPDIIYCFGWSNIISEEILKIPSKGVVGFHPTLLPKNRGRHPLIWAKILGLKKSGTTFFFMDKGADTGPILSQKSFNILFKDNAKELYAKMVSNALFQIKKLNKELSTDKYKTIVQDHESNYWRKRNKSDGIIDFRMSSVSICNLVRALTRPYFGASCYYLSKEIKIWDVELGNSKLSNVEPGKVIFIDNNRIEVKTGDSSIIIKDHEFKIFPKTGEYLKCKI